MKTLREYIDILDEEDNFDNAIKKAEEHLFAALQILDTHGQHKEEADSIYEILQGLGFRFPPGTGIK